VILNNRPGYKKLDSSAKHEILVPIIECSLPRPAWLAQDLAVNGYVAKPFKPEDLFNSIIEVVKRDDIFERSLIKEVNIN